MSDLQQLSSEYQEILARSGQLHSEFGETIARFGGRGRRPVSDILDDYETARSLIEEMMSGHRDLDELARKMKAVLPEQEPLRSQFRDSLERGDQMVNGPKELLDILVGLMNEELPRIVKSVYEGTQSLIEEAGTVEKKLEELFEGQALLERLVAFPEHAECPLLRKALDAFYDYESTLQRALANETAEREEEEFRNAVAGITYTATDKQVRYLISLGAKPRDLDGITKQQAGAMISRMKKG